MLTMSQDFHTGSSRTTVHLIFINSHTVYALQLCLLKQYNVFSYLHRTAAECLYACICTCLDVVNFGET